MTSIESCRDLLAKARHGVLATVAREPEGWPFASLVAVACDTQRRPLLLLSRLAEHTKNLEIDGRASLLLSDPAASDPLATGRMTVLGRCAPVPQDERAQALEAFLTAHPEAAPYASLGDFAPWRLEVARVRWVGGFGRMTWIDGVDLA